MITSIIINATISSIVIGLKNSYFMLIHLPSCYRTVQYANHINSYSLNQPISPFFANFPFLSYLGYFSFHGNCNFYDKLVIRLRVV